MKKVCSYLLVLGCLVCSHYCIAQNWVKKGDFIDGLTAGAFSFTINDTIYVGGAGDRSFFRYYAPTDTWLRIGNTPGIVDARENGIAFAIGGKGYIALGNDSTHFKKDLWQYDPTSRTWAQKADFPGGIRSYASCFVIGNKAYVGGGLDTQSIDPHRVPKNDFWEYDPATDVWTKKRNLPYDSSYLLLPFSFSIGSKGYISGGEIDSIVHAGIFDIKFPRFTYSYDPAADNWSRVADFPVLGRLGGISFVINNKAYCGMGELLGDTDFHDFFVYDPVTDVWTALPPSPMPARSYLISGTLSNGKTYLGTGINTSTGGMYYQDWWEFSLPASVAWVSADVNTISCYPNPAINKVHISFTGNSIPKNCTFTIYNIMGQKLMEGGLPANNILDITPLAYGQYLIEITKAGNLLGRTVLIK
ncbi:MAG: T9SS type A sorting domain-containing protein [Taibaiella sp.]|nr:T9SS type A sorting domain-containing protein [Taibaiella sp.]